MCDVRKENKERVLGQGSFFQVSTSGRVSYTILYTTNDLPVPQVDLTSF